MYTPRKDASISLYLFKLKFQKLILHQRSSLPSFVEYFLDDVIMLLLTQGKTEEPLKLGILWTDLFYGRDYEYM